MMRNVLAAVLALLALVACGKAPPSSIGVYRLVDEMKPEMVKASPAASKAAEPAGLWNFKERISRPTAKENQETLGWKAGVNVTGLAERNGRLIGRSTSGFPIIYVDRKPAADESDVPHSIEIHMRADKGANLSVSTEENEKLNFKEIVAIGSGLPWIATTPIVPGDDFQTYTITVPTAPPRLSTIRYLLIRPTDAEQAGFEIESIVLFHAKNFWIGSRLESAGRAFRMSSAKRWWRGPPNPSVGSCSCPTNLCLISMSGQSSTGQSSSDSRFRPLRVLAKKRSLQSIP